MQAQGAQLVATHTELQHAIDVARPLGLCGFKLGTEEEGLGADEVAAVAAIVPRDLQVLVKIGGPCARADLRLARQIGATAVIAPMVESPFAMQRFLEATDDEFASHGKQIQRAFNLETAQALHQLPALLDAAQGRLTFVNIGRSDLSASLGLQVGDEALHVLVANAIAQLDDRGLPAHVGGKVTRATLLPLLHRRKFAQFHTRFLAFRADLGEALLADAIDAALRIELHLLELLAHRDEERAEDHRARAAETRRRLAG